MSMTIAESLIAEGEGRGELRNARRSLCDVLEERFGEVPEPLKQQIECMTDAERLRAALKQSLRIKSFDELQL